MEKLLKDFLVSKTVSNLIRCEINSHKENFENIKIKIQNYENNYR
jgi:hypothetical protein